MTDPAQPPDADPPGDESDRPAVRVVDKRWWARETGPATAAGDNGGERAGRPAYVEELERQIADKDARLAEYAAKYTDAGRDFEQTRDRLKREHAKDVARGTRGVLSSFLEVVDNLDRAIAAAADDHDGPVLEGIRLVRDQFLATLGRYGVRRLDAAGQPFDPNLHDALTTVPVTDPAHDAVIITVLTPGYLVDDELLRPASVTVGALVGDG